MTSTSGRRNPNRARGNVHEESNEPEEEEYGKGEGSVEEEAAEKGVARKAVWMGGGRVTRARTCSPGPHRLVTKS